MQQQQTSSGEIKIKEEEEPIGDVAEPLIIVMFVKSVEKLDTLLPTAILDMIKITWGQLQILLTQASIHLAVQEVTQHI